MRVNIVGLGKGRELVPSEGIRWGVVGVVHKMPVNILFDMHLMNRLSQSQQGRLRMVFKKCRVTNTTIITPNDSSYEKHIKYPLEEIIEYFGVDYFASSIDYALAYAIYKGVKEIHIYGINFVDTNIAEYTRQKPSAEFWIGFAKGRGIKVENHSPSSTILKTHNGKLYGYETEQKEQIKTMKILN